MAGRWLRSLSLALILGASDATVGVDVSDAVSEATFQCLMGAGGEGPVRFAIARVYESFGQVDQNGIQTIKNAVAAGVPHADGYIFPCVSCGNPAGQVSAALTALRAAGAPFGMLWYDIEIYRWSSSQAANREFVTAMVDEGKRLGIKAGIYTNYNNWVNIVGASWNYPASQGLPLWYAHYDNSPSFSDFGAFGGWGAPAIKQYKGDATSCGVGVDYNWYPNAAERSNHTVLDVSDMLI